MAFKALTETGHENKAYDLTGKEALSYAQVADLMSEAWGTPIRYTNPTRKEFIRHWQIRGLSAAHINVMVGIYFTAKLGLAKKVTPDLGEVLGRNPTTITQYILDYREHFTPKTLR